MKLFATIYEVEHKDLSLPYTEIWQTMINDVNSNGDSLYYKLIAGRRLTAIILSSCRAAGSTSDLVKYNVLSAKFFKDQSGSYYISLKVGNLFTDSDNHSRLNNDDLHSNYSIHSRWIRNSSRVSLKQHIFLIEKFIVALNRSGWSAKQISPQTTNNQELLFKNSRGSYRESFPKSKALLRNAFARPQPWEIRIICPKSHFDDWRRVFVVALQGLFPNGGSRLMSIKHGSSESLSTNNRIFGVVTIAPSVDISSGDFASEIEALEAVGARFRLVREETRKNKWAIESIVFDLYLNAGGIPWVIDNPNLDGAQFIAIDAGHSVPNRKSRWASSRYDINTNEVTASWCDTNLGEHVDIDLYQKLLSIAEGDLNVTVYRDGRFLRERAHVEAVSKVTNHSVYEVSKYPKVIIYRGSESGIGVAAFGDMFEMPNNNKLIQTQYSKAEEYQGPLEIIGLSQNSFDDVAFDQFISLCSMPMLSFSNRPRLPAPIYWADLISKLDTTKWARAVGRGFKLSAPEYK